MKTRRRGAWVMSCPECLGAMAFQPDARVWTCEDCGEAWTLAALDATSAYRQGWIEDGRRAEWFARHLDAGTWTRTEDGGALRARHAVTLEQAARLRHRARGAFYAEHARGALHLARLAVQSARAYRLGGAAVLP